MSLKERWSGFWAARPGVRDHLVVLGLFVALTFAMLWPWTGHPFSHVADFGGEDPYFAMRCFRHVFGALDGSHPGRLFDLDLQWPHPRTLATTDAAATLLGRAFAHAGMTRAPLSGKSAARRSHKRALISVEYTSPSASTIASDCASTARKTSAGAWPSASAVPDGASFLWR